MQKAWEQRIGKHRERAEHGYAGDRVGDVFVIGRSRREASADVAERYNAMTYLDEVHVIELWLRASERIRQSGRSLAIVAMPVWLDT
jgi:hypothetical protein